jgi:ligand-binding sensor protein
MNSELSKYINIDKLKKIINYVYKEFKIPCWVVDNNGRIIISAGFSEICSRFHLTNMECSSNCQKCHEHIIAELKSYSLLYKKSTGILHKCDNGLYDIGVPIIINKRHIATLIAGQIFVDQINKEYFKNQASKYSFNENEYIKAVQKVKTIPSERVETTIDMLLNLVNLIKGSVFRIDNRRDVINFDKDVNGKLESNEGKIAKIKSSNNTKIKREINKDDIIEALEKNEFMVIYQPAVNTLTYEVEV